jgi:hypothetical protein
MGNRVEAGEYRCCYQTCEAACAHLVVSARASMSMLKWSNRKSANKVNSIFSSVSVPKDQDQQVVTLSHIKKV